MQEQPTMVPVSELVEDQQNHPRQCKINSSQVGLMVNSLEVGEELPAIVVCRRTKIVVDGIHRIEAWKKHLGSDCLVPVQFKDYERDGDRLVDGAKLSTGHGLNLTSYDRIHCMTRAKALQISLKEMAKVLKIGHDKAKALLDSRTAYSEQGECVPLKRSIAERLSGQTITEGQMDTNTKSSGWRPGFYIGQLIRLIKNDVINWDDELLVEQFKELYGLIGVSIVSDKKAKPSRVVKPVKKKVLAGV